MLVTLKVKNVLMVFGGVLFWSHLGVKRLMN